jgi:hypothetical protein
MDRRAWLLLAAVEARAPARLLGPAVRSPHCHESLTRGYSSYPILLIAAGPVGGYRVQRRQNADRTAARSALDLVPATGTTGCEEVGPLADVAMRMTLPIDARLRPGGAPTPGGPPRLSPVAGGARRRRGALPP